VTQASGGLVDDVQGWINGTFGNYGWHISRNGAGEDSTSKDFAGSAVGEGGNGQRAYLSVTYTAGGTAALTGTATASITETDIRTGGKTIILTLTGDTFVAAGAGVIGSVANTQALVDGIDSGQAEATGWDAVVKVGIDVGTAGSPLDVIRTSNTVCTITLDAEASYNITAQETITATIPAAVLTGGVPIVATPTFTVSTVTEQILWAQSVM
jgi:hypothetical protein